MGISRRSVLGAAAMLAPFGMIRVWRSGSIRTALADGEGSVVHWPSDLSNLQGIEQEHVPILKAHQAEDRKGVIDLEIRVGQRLHEMTPSHAIRWLQIWIDDSKACQMSLEPQGILPHWRYMIFRRPSLRVTVKIGCNQHGIWANRLVL